MIYLLDSNIFIQSKNTFFAFDICPGFWKWLSTSDKIHSISKVRDELLDGKDELAEWIKNGVNNSFFIEEDEKIQLCYRDIAEYVYALPERFKPGVKAHFLSKADGWLIAASKVLGATLVTHERYEPSCVKAIKIPNIAREFAVPYTDIFTVLRQFKVEFN